MRSAYQLLGVCLALILTALIALMVGGDSLDGVRQALGLTTLRNEHRGVYADCSRAENRGNRFCNPEEYQPSRKSAPKGGIVQQRPGRDAPFSLHGG